MLKRTLAAFAAVLVTGSVASAGNPWADYDWSAKPANPAYQTPSYFQAAARPQVNLGAAVYGAEAAQTDASFERTVGHSQGCPPAALPHTEAYAPITQPVVSQPAPAIVSGPAFGDSGCNTGVAAAPAYAAPAYAPSCNVSYAPSRTYSSSVFAEALFLNLGGNYNHSRPIVQGANGSLGPLGDTFGYDDLGHFDSTGWRIGGDLLFGNTCDTWLKGVGFTYADFGGFGNSRTGQFNGGLDFINDPNNVTHPGPTDYAGIQNDFITNDTHFRSLRQAVGEQNAIDGTNDCYHAGDEPQGLQRAATFRADNHLDIDGIGVNFIVAERCRKVQFSVGWQQYNIHNNAFAGVSGMFNQGNDANADWYAAGTAGLSNQALTNAGLAHVGGVDDGLANGAWLEMLSGAETSNTLNGINFGLQTRLLCCRNFDLVGGLNAGVFLNQAEARVYERYSELEDYGLSRYGRQYTQHEDVVSFAGGLNLTAGYWVNDCVRLYGGYELLWISGLALAPTQQKGLTLENYHFKHDGDLLLHGAKVGVEFCY